MTRLNRKGESISLYQPSSEVGNFCEGTISKDGESSVSNSPLHNFSVTSNPYQGITNELVRMLVDDCKYFLLCNLLQ